MRDLTELPYSYHAECYASTLGVLGKDDFPAYMYTDIMIFNRGLASIIIR